MLNVAEFTIGTLSHFVGLYNRDLPSLGVGFAQKSARILYLKRDVIHLFESVGSLRFVVVVHQLYVSRYKN